MKNIALVIVIFSINITIVSAQKLKSNSIIKAKSISYKTDTSSFGGMTVENERNVYRKKMPDPDGINVNIEKSDKVSTINAFKQVFSDVRLHQLKNENITIMYYISSSGKLLEVSFHLDKNTTITAFELEGLEEAIKKDVSFKLSGRKIKPDGFFVWYQNVTFRKILDGTFPG